MSPDSNGELRFPVSVKGVLIEDDRVVLLLNEREEWELPGGRLESGEDPTVCLEREFFEELGVEVVVEGILDCWLYRVLPEKEVLIVTYAVRRMDRLDLVVMKVVVPFLFGAWVLFLWEVVVRGMGVPAVLLPPPSAVVPKGVPFATAGTQKGGFTNPRKAV